MSAEVLQLLENCDEAARADALAANGVTTLDDLRLLSHSDFRELGFSIGARNRVQLHLVNPHLVGGGLPSTSIDGTVKACKR